jgi:PAS domain-containing protein
MTSSPTRGNIFASPMQGTDAFSCAFNFVQEPLFLLDTEGHVEVSNQAARRMLGEATNGDIRRSLRSDPAEFCAYLRRATRSRSPLVGAATFIGADGWPGVPERLRRPSYFWLSKYTNETLKSPAWSMSSHAKE